MTGKILKLFTIVIVAAIAVFFMCFFSFKLNFFQGERYYEREIYPNALYSYQKASRFSWNNPYLDYKIALTHQKMENHEQAIFYFKKLLNLKQTGKRVSFTTRHKLFDHLAESYEGIRDYEANLAYRKQIQKANPKDFEANRLLAKAYLMRGIEDKNQADFQSALNFFLKASQIAPEKITQEDQNLLELIKKQIVAVNTH